METPHLSDIQDYIRCLLKNWRKDTACQPIPNWISLFHDPQTSTPLDSPSQAKSHLLGWLTQLETSSLEEIRILRQHYIENRTIREIAQRWNYSIDQINRKQRNALEHLAAYVQTLIHAKIHENHHHILAQIPYPAQSDLFGVQTQIEQISGLLTKSVPPWSIALIGIGGLGKTSLANAAVKSVCKSSLPDFFAWVNMEKFPYSNSGEEMESLLINKIAQKLTPRLNFEEDTTAKINLILKKYACLIVLDGIPEEMDVSKITQAVSVWENPSKFLLTARRKTNSNESIFTIQLNELERESAITLFNHQIKSVGLPINEPLSAVDQNMIYRTIGGNPLAIKLIVGLLNTFNLNFILADMQKCQIRNIQELYEYIYLKAWHSLDKNAQKLLLAMPLVSEDGGTLAHIEAISSLTEKSLVNAIHTLNQRSLIEVLGNIGGKRYRIHHLTRSFLHTNIIQWPHQ